MSTQPAETAAARESEGQAGSRRWVTVAKIVLKIVGILVVVGVLMLLVRRYVGPYVDPFIAWVESLGVWAPIVFILGYIVATVAFIPGSLLTAAGGALFGLLWGTIYVAIAATTGACLAFLIARYFARGWVEAKLEGQPRFTAIDRAIGRDGGKIVALMRLSPVFPFNLLNYALGLTKVKFWHYALACLAMLPGTFLYVYYGAVGRAAATGGEGKTVWDWVQLGVGLAATLAVTWYITKKAKKALDEQTDIDVNAEENTVEEEASDE